MIIQPTIPGFWTLHRFFSVLSRLSHIVVVNKVRSTIDSITTNEECIPLTSLIALTDYTWILRIQNTWNILLLLSPTIHLHQILFRPILHTTCSFILFNGILLIFNVCLMSRLSNSIKLNTANWSFLTYNLILNLVLDTIQTIWIIIG